MGEQFSDNETPFGIVVEGDKQVNGRSPDIPEVLIDAPPEVFVPARVRPRTPYPHWREGPLNTKILDAITSTKIVRQPLRLPPGAQQNRVARQTHFAEFRSCLTKRHAVTNLRKPRQCRIEAQPSCPSRDPGYQSRRQLPGRVPLSSLTHACRKNSGIACHSTCSRGSARSDPARGDRRLVAATRTRADRRDGPMIRSNHPESTPAPHKENS